MSLKDIANKWESFGWNTIEVDGHNIQALQDSFGKDFNNEKPKAIIAHTIKGKGFPFAENNPYWHHKNFFTDQEVKNINQCLQK